MNIEMPIPELAEAQQLAASGRFVDAELAYVRAINSSRSPIALNQYATYLRRVGRLADALVHFEEAIKRSPVESEAKATAYRGLGDLLRLRHDLARAQESYESALAIDGVLNLEEGLAEDHRAIARLAMERGQLVAAEQHFEAALRIDNARKDDEAIAEDKRGLGELFLRRGSLDQAEQLFEELKREHGSAQDYMNLAALAERREDWMRVQYYYHEAVDLLGRSGDLARIAEAQSKQGIAYLRLGDLDLAANRLQQAYRGFDDLGQPADAAQAWLFLAQVFRLQQKFSDAERSALKAIRIFEKLNQTGPLADAYLELGRFYRETGKREGAQSVWSFARSLYEQVNDTHGIAEIERQLAGA
jgi:tetratricopeptide (TPR) repeat protein